MTTYNKKPELILIEDNPLISLDAADNLAQAGFQVALAADVKAAEKLLEVTEFDAGIADFDLGKENSVSIVEKLHNDNIPVAIVSGSKISDIRETVTHEIAIFQKPANYVEVASKLLRDKIL